MTMPIDPTHPAVQDLAAAVADQSTGPDSAGPAPGNNVQSTVWGTVDSIQSSSLTIKVSGSATTSAGIKYLRGYSPVVGDNVMCSWVGTDLVVVDAVASATSPTSGFVAGMILDWYDTTPPGGWLVLDGSSQVCTTYPVLAVKYGCSGGHFTLPDARGRMVIGVSGSYALASTGGSVTITSANLPVHTHAAGTLAGALSGAATTTGVTGGGSISGTLGTESATHTHGMGTHHHVISWSEYGHAGTSFQDVSVYPMVDSREGGAPSITSDGGDGGTTGTEGATHTHDASGLSAAGQSIPSLSVSGSVTISGATADGGFANTGFLPPYIAFTKIIKAG